MNIPPSKILKIELITLAIFSLMITESIAEPPFKSEGPKGEVISIDRTPRRQVGGGKAIIEIFKEGSSAFIGRLTLAPKASVPLHRDPTEEYLLIEAGAGMITIDGIRSNVKQGDLIYMPAKAEVSFKNGEKPLIALQIFAGPESARKYDQWSEVSDKP